MEQEAHGAPDSHHGHPHHGHDVTITVDGEERRIPGGEYLVRTLKTVLGIPADYELDEVVHGEFRPLSDDAKIRVHTHQVFVSHVRCGGSA